MPPKLFLRCPHRRLLPKRCSPLPEPESLIFLVRLCFETFRIHEPGKSSIEKKALVLIILRKSNIKMYNIEQICCINTTPNVIRAWICIVVSMRQVTQRPTCSILHLHASPTRDWLAMKSCGSKPVLSSQKWTLANGRPPLSSFAILNHACGRRSTTGNPPKKALWPTNAFCGVPIFLENLEGRGRVRKGEDWQVTKNK